MLDKDHLKAFQNAAWKTPQEIDAFVASVGAVLAPDVLKLLELLTQKGAAQEITKQRARCQVFNRMAETVPHKGLFKPYIEALKQKDQFLRSSLLHLIPKVNNIAEHELLVGYLESPETDLRVTAKDALKKIAGKTVFEMLQRSIEKPSFAGRLEAIDILIQTAGHHAIPALRSALLHGKINEKLSVLKALGDRRFVEKDLKGALEVIAAALSDPDEPVMMMAIQQFCALCSEDDYFNFIVPALDAPSLRVVELAVRGLQRFSSSRAIAQLERKVRMGPNAIRFAALETLEAIGHEDVLSALVSALSHKQLVVRTRAGEILTRLSRSGKVDLARTVIWLLRSRDENVRRMAVELARTVKDEEGALWPKLLACLRDEDWWVRERVVDALIEMAGTKLTRHMVGYLQDPSDVVRRYAADVLSRLRDPQALGALIRAATADSDWWVRERAVEAVGSINDPRSIPYLADLVSRDEDLRVACLAALGLMRAVSAAPQVLGCLGHQDPDVRLATVSCLARFNDPTHAAQVQPLATDPDPHVRTAALKLLGHWNITLNLGTSTRTDGTLSPLDRMLAAVARAEADDLIIAAGRKPMVKKMGKIVPLSETVLTTEHLRQLLLPVLTPQQITDLHSLKEVDLSYEVKMEALRFRANIFMQACGLSGVFRIIKGELPEMEKLGLPPIVKTFGELKNGLVLVGGPTGSGKSTTLAALIDHINRTSARHIITLEDPIEVLHRRKKGVTTQRELGSHTRSFTRALRATLREDPDVILVGEMRDLATIGFAVSAAETGHLVFGTIHTAAADTTVDRLINTFPAGQQEQVRSMLSESLRAVVCQYLLRRKDGGRVLAMEVMVNNDAVGSMIRKGKTFQIPSIVATAREQGMQSMDIDLMRLYREGIISIEEAFVKARDKKEFEALMEGEKPRAGTAAKPNPSPGATEAPRA